MDHNHMLRLLIPSKFAGGVIGKGGEVIKRLRADHNIHLNIPDSSAPERVVHIDGEYEAIINCLRDIMPKIVDERPNKNNEPEGEVRMLVHQSHAGALIGKGGSRIKELRENTGAQLKVFATCAPISTDRVVLIAGEAEKIIAAVQAIHDTLVEIPLKVRVHAQMI